MIKKDELLEAIAECQGQRYPNANTCMKLASYYTILDHIDKEEKTSEPIIRESYSYSPPPYESESEFGKRIQKMDTNDVLEVMDELMETLAVINPRLYNGVMRKL